jgi:hypothetical protein
MNAGGFGPGTGTSGMGEAWAEVVSAPSRTAVAAADHVLIMEGN